jgi:hypothetical protein
VRFVPTLPVGFTDTKLIKLFTDILRCLSNVLESNTYTVETVWRVPFVLQIPTAGNVRRTEEPSIVRLGRAIVSTDLQAVVHFGACNWQWVGNGNVQINDVDGLVNGVKYKLTFEVVS